MKRYPLAELIRASGMTEHLLSQRVGLVGTPLIRAREHGLIESAADRYACRAGLVPWLVWSDWLEDLEVECAECGARFVPSRKGHRFCRERCSRRRWDRAKVRERYQSDPEFAAAERARSAEYRKTCGRAIRLREQQYRIDNAEVLAAKRKAYYAANAEELKAKQKARDRARRKAAA